MENQTLTGDLAGAAVQAATENLSTPTQTQEEMVPLSALQAERKQRQELQSNVKLMQDHLELLRANSSQQQQVPSQPDLRDDDVLTVGEAKKYISQMQQQYNMSIEELKMQQSYPDYVDTIRNHLPDVLKENPEFQEEIQRAKNPYRMAYFLAKKSDSFLNKKQESVKNETAERILQNSQRPGNLTALGQTAPQNAVQSWRSMSDAEFMRHVHRNLGSA